MKFKSTFIFLDVLEGSVVGGVQVLSELLHPALLERQALSEVLL